MPKVAVNYTNTVIYKIVNIATGEILYIVSTTNFVKRKCMHKRNTATDNGKLYQDIRSLGGWDQVLMIMVEKYTECKNSLEKLKREREWYDELLAIPS